MERESFPPPGRLRCDSVRKKCAREDAGMDRGRRPPGDGCRRQSDSQRSADESWRAIPPRFSPPGRPQAAGNDSPAEHIPESVPTVPGFRSRPGTGSDAAANMVREAGTCHATAGRLLRFRSGEAGAFAFSLFGAARNRWSLNRGPFPAERMNDAVIGDHETRPGTRKQSEPG